MAKRTKKTGEVGVPKRITKQWLSRFDLEHITDLRKEDALKVIKSGYYQAKKAKKEFRAAKLISPAFESYFDKDEKFKIPTDESIQGLWREVWRVMKFARAKTSSVQGAKEYWKAEDRRIFHDTVTHMSEHQRKRYWSAYMEFINQNPFAYDYSERVQQVLAQMSFWKRRKWNAQDLTEMLYKVTESIEEFDQTWFDPNAHLSADEVLLGRIKKK